MQSTGFQIDLVHIILISPVIMIMILLSIVVVAVTIERAMYFRARKLDSNVFVAKIKSYIVDGDYEGAIEFCKKSKGPIPMVVKDGLEERKLPREEISKIMESTMAEQKLNMERYVPILGTLGNTSPFIGLLGTVIGIINAFAALAGAAGGGPEVVMIGIAEALVATAAGLAVAIPAVILFNIFTIKIKNVVVEMDTAIKKVIVLMANYAEVSHANRRK